MCNSNLFLAILLVNMVMLSLPLSLSLCLTLPNFNQYISFQSNYGDLKWHLGGVPKVNLFVIFNLPIKPECMKQTSKWLWKMFSSVFASISCFTYVSPCFSLTTMPSWTCLFCVCGVWALLTKPGPQQSRTLFWEQSRRQRKATCRRHLRKHPCRDTALIISFVMINVWWYGAH